MIKSLSIENFALIDKLAIAFQPGFTTITGETGAGKSILLGALGLALGNRADLTSMKDKERKCIIEATFHIGNYGLQAFFDEADMDYEPETIIRREILPGGKSRAFVNDSPVNLQELQKLGRFLIDIHSQHQTRDLTDDAYQFQIIDAIAGNATRLTDYSQTLIQYKSTRKELARLKEEQATMQREADYNAFLLEELLTAKIVVGEMAELEQEVATLSNVEALQEHLQRALSVASDEQFGIRQNLREFRASLQKLAGISSEYEMLLARTSTLMVEFDDVTAELETMADKVVSNPQRLEEANARLQMLSALMKKHLVSDESALIAIQNALDEKVVSGAEIAIKIEKAEASLQALSEQLDAIAGQLHQSRGAAVPTLASEITEILARLGMPHARFDIQFHPVDQYLSNGKEEVAFRFAANKGSDFGLLKKVASGGEMSRIMLAVKSILARYQNLPTIIFDEIDTGVSGEIAGSMGDIMKAMSGHMQLFSITHLPQIAAKGNQQYKVFKEVQGSTTVSSIVPLSDAERVDEIARMLSGATISDSAIAHARALLD